MVTFCYAHADIAGSGLGLDGDWASCLCDWGLKWRVKMMSSTESKQN
jgi:hypothetical protein